jgi:hypothetical protein
MILKPSVLNYEAVVHCTTYKEAMIIVDLLNNAFPQYMSKGSLPSYIESNYCIAASHQYGCASEYTSRPDFYVEKGKQILSFEEAFLSLKFTTKKALHE